MWVQISVCVWYLESFEQLCNHGVKGVTEEIYFCDIALHMPQLCDFGCHASVCEKMLIETGIR